MSGIAVHIAGRAPGPVEGDKKAVAHRVDFVATVPFDLGPDDIVVAREKRAPAAVTEVGRLSGGTNDIGEQDRGQHAVDDRAGEPAGHELLDGVEERSGVAGEDECISPGNFDVARAVDRSDCTRAACTD